LLTAIGNDVSFAEVFSFQLRILGRPGDGLIAISSSGNSENIVQALRTAKELKMSTIALTGYDGGQAASLADINLHVDSQNYGVAEDGHQSIMHALAQYIRQAHMRSDLFGKRKF